MGKIYQLTGPQSETSSSRYSRRPRSARKRNASTFFINDVRHDGENEYGPLVAPIRAVPDAGVDNAR